jgi:hypothetical protein
MSVTEKYQVGDLIIQEGGNHFNREAKTIDIANNAEIVVGQMLEAGSGPPQVKAIATDANAAYICLENYKNTTGATVRRTIPVIWRGGAGLIIKSGLLSGEDTSNATAIAALKTALGGEEGVVYRTELS